MTLAAVITCCILGMVAVIFILHRTVQEKERAMESIIARTVAAHANLRHVQERILDLKKQRTTNQDAVVADLKKQIAHQQEIILVWKSLHANLETQNADLKRRLDGTFAASEVRGMADFPVLRGMSRHGDTVESFAKREGTTPEVILALNPWLKKRKKPMVDYQTVWIPRREKP